ncbi:MAG: cupin domain-containing protein [Gammaproteobacteria bacterium]|nr:MAG: cupin domain-containing protein [Gammaproteobacteria bacterium]
MNKQFTVDQALDLVSTSKDKAYGVLLEHGTLELGYYKPHGIDPQDPHDRDEVYIVQSGSGYFVVENDRQPFQAGDALFVPAFVVHRFEDFTDDFAAWVIFYGPQGGD